MSNFRIEFLDEENSFSKEEVENLKNALNFALENVLKPDFNISVNVTSVSGEEIQNLNRETRNVDRVTDVLSFPMLEFEKPEILRDKLMPWDLDPEDESVFIGDIILCRDKIESQAEEYGHSFSRESIYLTLHGLLHLFGYDHIEENDKLIMRNREKEILKMLKFE